MTDLTKIDKPFDKLDRETKIALFAAWVDGAQIENNHGAVNYPAWNRGYTYRVATTKPSIDWDHVAPQFKWMATDANGMTWLYEVAPTIWQTQWQGGASKRPDPFASFRAGTCDWRDSLVQRPEGV
jgi:hypothetical protein